MPTRPQHGEGAKPTKFQEKTAVMRFFRDLHDLSRDMKERFEKVTESHRITGCTMYSYDIRTEVKHNLTDEADRNLLYNLTQFLIDSRAALAQKLVEQRVRLELPEAADVMRISENLEEIQRRFSVLRPLHPPRSRRAVDALEGSSNLSAVSFSFMNRDLGEAEGIDQQTFVDTFAQVLSSEIGRVNALAAGSGNGTSGSPEGSDNEASKLSKKMSKKMSLSSGRSERRALLKLYDAMDVDDCGVVTWDQFIAFMARLRLGGDEVIEEQREGKLTLKLGTVVEHSIGSLSGSDESRRRVRCGDNTWPGIGLRKKASSVGLWYSKDAQFLYGLCRYEPQDGSKDGKKNNLLSGQAINPESKTEVIFEVMSCHEGGKVALRLMHRRPVSPAISAVVYVPSPPLRASADDDDTDDTYFLPFFATFYHGFSFQCFRLQPQPGRLGFDLLPLSPSGVQLPKVPAHALYNAPTGLIICGSLEGEIFTYQPSLLCRGFRIQHPISLHQPFTEPITTLVTSTNGQFVFASCLFGGVAVYSPVKDQIIHRYTAMHLGQAVSIRTMAYIEELNLLATGGKTSDVHLWMSFPNHGVDAYVGTLRHESDPHGEDVVHVWADRTVSPRVVCSLDRSGKLKLWELRQFRCLQTIDVGDAGYFSTIAACAVGKGELFLAGNSSRTHQSFIDMVKVERELVNPIAVAQLESTVHCAGVHILEDVATAVSAVDGSLITHDLKTGEILTYMPSLCGEGSSVTVMTVAMGKKIFVGMLDGRIMSFSLASGDQRATFQPLSGEVSGLVVAESQSVLVAATNRDTSGSHGADAIRVYMLPDRVAEQDIMKPIPCQFSFNVSGGFGIATLCQRRITATGNSAAVVLWDTSSRMHQVLIEMPRVVLSSSEALGLSHASGVPPTTKTNEATTTATTETMSKGEINFKSDLVVFEMLNEGAESCKRDVKCCCDLFPFGFVACADSNGKIRLSTAAPHELSIVREWDHFSSRRVVAGVNKCVVTALCLQPGTEHLITADDHGCISVYNLAPTFAALRANNCFSHHNQATAHQPPLGIDGSSSSSVVRALLSAVEVPLLHCFHISSEPLVSVCRLQEYEAYCVGLAAGSIRFVSTTGSVVGELFPDPKFLTEAPPKYFLLNIDEVEDAKRPRPRTRASQLWGRLRGSVLGEAHVMANSVKELISRARETVDLAHENDDDDSDSETVGSNAKRKTFYNLNTPPSTPTRAKSMHNTLNIESNISRPEILVHDPNQFVARGGLMIAGDEQHIRRQREAAANAAAESERNAFATELTQSLRHLRQLEGVPATDSTTEVLLTQSYASPPVLYPPSIFKALTRVVPGLPPPADLPVHTPAWISTLVKKHAALQEMGDNAQLLVNGGGSGHEGSLKTKMVAFDVPQLAPQLKVLNLPNKLASQAWNYVVQDEDEDMQRYIKRLGGSLNDSVASSLSSSQVHSTTNTTTAHHYAEGEEQQHAPVLRPAASPSLAMQALLQRTPGRLSDLMVVKPNGRLSTSSNLRHVNRPQSSASTGFASDRPTPTLEALLHASAPLYPLQESPFMDPGRPAPALSPVIFSALSGGQAEEDMRREGTSGSRFNENIPRSGAASSTTRPTSALATQRAASAHSASWDVREQRAKHWESQFRSLNQSASTKLGRPSGKITKLRQSNPPDIPTQPLRPASALDVASRGGSSICSLDNDTSCFPLAMSIKPSEKQRPPSSGQSHRRLPAQRPASSSSSTTSKPPTSHKGDQESVVELVIPAVPTEVNARTHKPDMETRMAALAVERARIGRVGIGIHTSKTSVEQTRSAQ